MEKFVIEGGAPLSGEVTAAGNKNAALPILAASLLTEEELSCTGCRGSATSTPSSRCSSASASRRPGAATTACGSARATVTEVDVDEELAKQHPRLVPARRPAAGPLRRGAHAAAGRRLHRPPPARPPPRRLRGPRRPGRGRPRIELSAPDGGLRACEIFMDEPWVMGTENALMAAALTPGPDDDLQRRLASRTSRTSRAC